MPKISFYIKFPLFLYHVPHCIMSHLNDIFNKTNLLKDFQTFRRTPTTWTIYLSMFLIYICHLHKWSFSIHKVWVQIKVLPTLPRLLCLMSGKNEKPKTIIQWRIHFSPKSRYKCWLKNFLLQCFQFSSYLWHIINTYILLLVKINYRLYDNFRFSIYVLRN